MVCFLRTIKLMEEAFLGRFRIGEILIVDSNLNKSTNLWWIKIGLPWIKPTTNDLDAPWMALARAYTGNDTGVVPI